MWRNQLDRDVMHLTNTEQRYGIAAVIMHWLMAALIATLIGLGVYMVRLPDVGFNAKKIILVLVHKELGVLALALATARIVWRQVNPLPQATGAIPEWQQVSAAFVHLCFYGLMLALPASGWI